MQLNVECFSDVGSHRQRNEDVFVVGTVYSAPAKTAFLKTTITSGSETDVAVIDGMGGESSGERAAQIVAATISSSDLTPAQSVALSNESVYAEIAIDPTRRRMGAAIVGVRISPDGFSAYSAGDCRCYHGTGLSLVLVTRDHVDSSGRLTTAIGGHDRPTGVHLDEMSLDVRPRDHLLLCSDGVHGVLSHEELAELASTGSAEEIVTQAIRSGSKDNCTAVLIRVMLYA